MTRFALFLLIGCHAAADPPAVSIAAPTQASATPEPVAVPARATRQTVQIEDATWVIIEARDLGTHITSTVEASSESKATTGRFVAVHYALTNLGRRDEVLLDRPKIVDAKGREFGPIDMESFYIPKGTKSVGTETLSPNVQREFWTIIEVPAEAQALAFQVHGFSLMGEKRTVALGL